MSKSCPHIHDQITHGKEGFLAEGLREEVGQVVHRAHERDNDGVILHFFSNEEVSPVYVFSAGVMLRVVCKVTPRLIIHGEGSWIIC